MAVSVVPMQNREWLKYLRSLEGYTVESVAKKCQMSHVTYLSLENGASKARVYGCTLKTVNIVANTLGVKKDLFFYKTDENGRLSERSSVHEIITLFISKGYRSVIFNEVVILNLFSEDVANYVIENILYELKRES